MKPSRGPLRYFGTHPDIANAALAVALSIALVINGALDGLVEPPGEERSLNWLGLLLTALAPLPLAVRHRYPRAVLAATVVVLVVYFVLDYPPQPVPIGLVIALYTVAATGPRRWSLWAGATLAVLVGSALFAFGPDERDWTAFLAIAATVGIPLAVGDAVRYRRDYVAHIEETREAEVSQRVQDERLRIARDLHDVLSHGIATINVQAGVAAHVIDEQPEVAKQALVEIKLASKTALHELRAMLDVLRSDELAGSRAPAPGLADLDELVESVRRAGLPVELQVDAAGDGLEPAVDVAAYRVVQEALTNVIRHANASAVHVAVEQREDGLRVEVTDDGTGVGAENGEGAGQGLQGLTERVEGLGGTVEAGPRFDGGYRVAAFLPGGEPAP